MRLRYLLIAGLSVVCNGAVADSPLPPPGLTTICNAPNTHCATSDPISRRTTLVGRASGEALWVIDGFHRFFDVSNDGQALFVQSGFGNLLPTDVTRDQILFTIFRDGKLLQSVSIGALFDNPASLQRTASHLSWGQLEKIDANDNVVLMLVDGRRVAYSLVTGQKAAP